MATTNTISEVIEHELLRWPGVTMGAHRFGGCEFRVGKREIGHLHGDHVADLPFSRAIRDELVSSGKASPHHHLSDSGWVSLYLRGEKDVPALLALFRRNYERLLAPGQGGETDTAPPAVDSNQPSADKELP